MPTMSPAEPDLVIGQKLGHFVVEERVAHGGMGIVYRAVQAMSVKSHSSCPPASRAAEHCRPQRGYSVDTTSNGATTVVIGPADDGTARLMADRLG